MPITKKAFKADADADADADDSLENKWKANSHRSKRDSALGKPHINRSYLRKGRRVDLSNQERIKKSRIRRYTYCINLYGQYTYNMFSSKEIIAVVSKKRGNNSSVVPGAEEPPLTKTKPSEMKESSELEATSVAPSITAKSPKKTSQAAEHFKQGDEKDDDVVSVLYTSILCAIQF